MDIRQHVIALNERRMRIWNEAQGFLDGINGKGRDMNGEERAQWDRYNTDIDAIDAEVRQFVERETREVESAQLREAHPGLFGPATRTAGQANNEADQLRAVARGDIDVTTGQRRKEMCVNLEPAFHERKLLRQGAGPAELRALLWDTGSIASAVPTEMARSLYEHLEASVSMMRAPTFKFTTSGGENMDFPRIDAHGIGTQVIAQGTAIGGTDPTFAKMTLGAWKYGQLVQVSSETIQDNGFPILDFVARNVGRAVGRLVDADLVAGSGSSKPNGVMTAIGGAGTIATGGSLVDPTYEKLVDLVYSVNDEYRASGSAAWLLRDSTAGTIRKLRDGGGTVGLPLWQPSVFNGLTAGQADSLLGYPVYTDPNVASLASNAKIIAFGDFSAYYIRMAGDFVFERSDDYAFNTDLVTFRGKMRVDGDLIDTGAINIMKRSV